MHHSHLLPCCPAETITVDPATGNLLLPDKLGAVHLAHRLPNGSYSLQQKPLAQTGPGRVLGSKLDAEGRLVMCDVSKVRPPYCEVLANLLPCMRTLLNTQVGEETLCTSCSSIQASCALGILRVIRSLRAYNNNQLAALQDVVPARCKQHACVLPARLKSCCAAT